MTILNGILSETAQAGKVAAIVTPEVIETGGGSIRASKA